MTDISAYKNGVPYHEKSLQERAFVYSDGVFETMRCVSRNIPLWSFHLKRLALAKKLLHLHFDEKAIQTFFGELFQTLEYDNARIKLILSRCSENRASYPQGNVFCDYFISVQKSMPYRQKRPVELCVVPEALQLHAHYARCKLISRVAYTVPVATLKFKTDQEALFLDAAGNVIEAMHHNIFMIKNMQLVTPSLVHCGVHGVMRACIIENVAPTLGIDVVQKELKLDDLDDADAIFICNAFDGVVLVNNIAERAFENHNDAAIGLFEKINDCCQQEFRRVTHF